MAGVKGGEEVKAVGLEVWKGGRTEGSQDGGVAGWRGWMEWEGGRVWGGTMKPCRYRQGQGRGGQHSRWIHHRPMLAPSSTTYSTSTFCGSSTSM